MGLQLGGYQVREQSGTGHLAQLRQSVVVETLPFSAALPNARRRTVSY